MTEQTLSAATWCGRCGTLHAEGDLNACPGEILATGAERYGFRLLADTPRGPEVYGTLVAPAGDRWRARILTFPNILWVVAHGGTMKFVGRTPAEAENLAIDFLRKHCQSRGFKMRKEVPSVESAALDAEQDALTLQSEEVRASQRQMRSVSVRYGVGRTVEQAETDDLSEGGLFIRTDSPMPVGTSLQLYLETEGYGIPLRGVVRWVRAEEEEGRPAGMGIKLVAPHPRYLHYIRQQSPGSDGEDESATYDLEEWEADG